MMYISRVWVIKIWVFCGFSDLCKSFGIQILPLVDVEAINELLTAGRRSRHTKTKNLSQWATREVRKLKNQVNTTTW